MVNWGKNHPCLLNFFFKYKVKIRNKDYFLLQYFGLKKMDFQQVDEKQEQNDTNMLSMPLF